MKRKLLFVLIMFISGIMVSQGQVISFTIKEAQDYALENNKTFKNAKADVKLADAQIIEARGAGLPKLAGTVDYMTNFGYEFLFELGGGDTEPAVIDYTLMDLGDFEVLKILEGMSSGGGSTIKMTDQFSANLQVSQLIFSGQYWVGLEMARLGKVIREQGLNMTALDIKEQVINSYHLVLLTQELTRVIDGNIENLNEIKKHTQNLYEAGMAEKTDVDQMKINISQLENSKRAMARSMELNLNMFRMLLGLQAGTQVSFSENLESILEGVEGAMISNESFNVANNPAYQMMAVQEKIGEQQLNLQKWSYAPTLVGFYAYKEKILTGGFDLSPKHAAGFTMSVPIFDGWTKSAQMTKAKIELDKTSRTKSLLEDQLALQNNQLSFDMANAYENYLTQKENIDVAKGVFESIRRKYEEGVISSLELTQANSNLLQAENNYVSSVMELLKSKLSLDKLYNKL